MRGRKTVLFAAIVAVGLGGYALAAPIPDFPTTTPCLTATDCAVNQYCHPFAHVCYVGGAVVCNTTADCKMPGAYCHFNRCHVGATPCFTNRDCKSSEYCHVGVCHAEACQTDNDCPVGVPCISFRNVCALP